MMNLIFKDVKKEKDNFEMLNALYHRSFPDKERAPMQLLMERYEKNKAEFYSIYDSDQWIGLIYSITYKELTYVFYLAIDEKYQGQGYGSEILKEIKKKYNHTLMLSIEEIDEKYDNYNQRLKRKQFYEKNGFESMNIVYKEYGVNYEMMIYGKKLEFDCFIELITDYMPGYKLEFIKKS